MLIDTTGVYHQQSLVRMEGDRYHAQMSLKNLNFLTAHSVPLYRDFVLENTGSKKRVRASEIDSSFMLNVVAKPVIRRLSGSLSSTKPTKPPGANRAACRFTCASCNLDLLQRIQSRLRYLGILRRQRGTRRTNRADHLTVDHNRKAACRSGKAKAQNPNAGTTTRNRILPHFAWTPGSTAVVALPIAIRTEPD